MAENQSTTSPHFAFLDGLRALAAWYVVVHHAWLGQFGGFPDNGGPWWTGWLRWGHLAVVVFIVVSGFSLALGPARNGDRVTGGVRTFVRRRAWRILPPYWVALGLSAVIIAVYTGAHTGTEVDARAIAVHGLLLQDVIGSHSPNGAFWSIAIEWQIYFVFPLLLLLVRRLGAQAMAGLTSAAVVAAYVAGNQVAPLHKLLDLTPQFLALFAFGVVAGRSALLSGSVALPSRGRLVIAGAVAGVAGLAFLPPAVVVRQFFWVDLALGGVTAVALWTLACSGMPRLRAALEVPALRFTGRFSYSTYLLHAPLMTAASLAVVTRLATGPTERFLLTLALVLPMIFVATYAFHLAFERPFMVRRSLAELRVGKHPGPGRAGIAARPSGVRSGGERRSAAAGRNGAVNRGGSAPLPAPIGGRPAGGANVGAVLVEERER